MTFFHAFDVDDRAVAWLMTGTHNSDDDFARYVASMRKLDDICAEQDGAALLLVDPGNPAPSSRWRKEIADASSAIKSKPAFAMVTQSQLIRGVVTAINWLRPPSYPTHVTGDVDTALAWLETTLARPVPMRRLLDEVRAQASQNAYDKPR